MDGRKCTEDRTSLSWPACTLSDSHIKYQSHSSLGTYIQKSNINKLIVTALHASSFRPTWSSLATVSVISPFGGPHSDQLNLNSSRGRQHKSQTFLQNMASCNCEN